QPLRGDDRPRFNRRPAPWRVSDSGQSVWTWVEADFPDQSPHWNSHDHRRVDCPERIARRQSPETGSGGCVTSNDWSWTFLLPIYGRPGARMAALGVVLPAGFSPGLLGIFSFRTPAICQETVSSPGAKIV